MDLIIGSGSQLTSYFDSNNTKIISSRNVDEDYEGYDKVILTFAEQRTFLDLKEEDFTKVNVNYTSKIIDSLYSKNKKIIVFGTSELWNDYEGPININLPFKFKYSPYIKSKELLVNTVREKKSKGLWDNVHIIHPFNFNTPHRHTGFFFGKIFHSIINRSSINVGNLDIYRDIIHPKLIIEELKIMDSDILLGSGISTNVREFVSKLYKHYGMDYKDFVVENERIYSPHFGKSFWSDTKKTYTNLINDTIVDINNFMIKNNL
jgi:nucleoside-diphosphate-sugar epimerase